jgi:hypothetical protein
VQAYYSYCYINIHSSIPTSESASSDLHFKFAFDPTDCGTRCTFPGPSLLGTFPRLHGPSLPLTSLSSPPFALSFHHSLLTNSTPTPTLLQTTTPTSLHQSHSFRSFFLLSSVVAVVLLTAALLCDGHFCSFPPLAHPGQDQQRESPVLVCACVVVDDLTRGQPKTKYEGG